LPDKTANTNGFLRDNHIFLFAEPTVKTNFISTCEISEKARDGKISFAEKEKIFFSYNPHENFPAKKMNKYFLHMKKYF
jgi:hypothetical protein